MDHVGTWGRVPNLYWHAPHEDQLRRHPRFVALPPTDAVTLGSEASYRFVRQGTELWDDLHAGRLTTGCLNGALGFQEDGVCKALGMRARGANHGPLISAWYRLLQPRLEHARGAPSAGDVEAANEAAVAEYNRALSKMGPVAPSRKSNSEGGVSGDVGGCGAAVDDVVPACPSDVDVARLGSDPRQQHARRPQPRRGKGKAGRGKGGKKRRSRAPNEDSSSVVFGQPLASGTPQEVVEATPWWPARASRCRRAAQRGENGVRMAWGSAQEAGTMATLLLAHPDWIAEEVGLCMVDTNELPDEWELGKLPPIGASPDGIVRVPKYDDVDFDRCGDHVNEGKDAVAWERLVIEVKNSSPFRRAPNRPGRYVVFDRDPFDSPPAYHMPQLQMEMLAAGARAGLLAMQSATRGVRVFRVERDDAYLRAMLSMLSAFHEEYVLRGIEPPERMFASRPDHRALVTATIRMARGASVWEHIPTHLKLPGETYDMRPFVNGGGC